MRGIGVTVFDGATREQFDVHVLGILSNVLGPRRSLVVARLEGGPLARTGVIQGMSGSPVYIDDRLVGAVSYALGSFSREAIAGITPIEEMAATDATPLREARRRFPPVPPPHEVTRRHAGRRGRAGASRHRAVRPAPRRRPGQRPRPGRCRAPRRAAPADCHAAGPERIHAGDPRPLERGVRRRQPGAHPRRVAGRRTGQRRRRAFAGAGRSNRREPDPGRSGAGGNRHGDPGGRWSGLRLRPSVLQPRPGAVAHDASARHHPAPEPRHLLAPGRHRRRARHLRSGSLDRHLR